MNHYLYDRQTISNKIFEFIYGCAMRDAILQKAFIGEKSWVEGIEEPKSILKTYIDKVLNNEFESQENHDEIFLETANDIFKAINNQKPDYASDVFSFGNAQKLINITAKHIYSLCYGNSDLRDSFRYCHCPLDSIMLNKVWKMYKDCFGNDARRNQLLSKEFFCQSWGNEGMQENIQPELLSFPKRYGKFQNAIRDIIGDNDLYSLEFDYLVWQ